MPLQVGGAGRGAGLWRNLFRGASRRLHAALVSSFQPQENRVSRPRLPPKIPGLGFRGLGFRGAKDAEVQPWLCVLESRSRKVALGRGIYSRPEVWDSGSRCDSLAISRLSSSFSPKKIGFHPGNLYLKAMRLAKQLGIKQD